LNINNARRRKAISPVLATVILIAITLIAAIAVAGFVFGLFGSFTSTARVSVEQAALPHGIVSAAGLTVMNTGTSNTVVNSMTLTYGGVTCVPTITTTTATAGVSGIPVPITALGSCVAGSSGETFVGSLATSNGAQVPFSGVFS
jgi:flagellin-like protein